MSGIDAGGEFAACEIDTVDGPVVVVFDADNGVSVFDAAGTVSPDGDGGLPLSL